MSNASNTQPDTLQPGIVIMKGFCYQAHAQYWALEQLSCSIEHDFSTTWIQST